MRIYIKYMVSLRCKMIVKQELQRLKIPFLSIDLGTVELAKAITLEQHDELQISMHKYGLELLDDKKTIIVEQVKCLIIEMVHYSEEVPSLNTSRFISEKLGYNYTYLSNLFSEVKGMTIQHFIILQKIERAKELLLYNDITLTEIAHLLKYSSVAYLSNQFKKVTGLSPSFFRGLKNARREGIDQVGELKESEHVL
jgi:YesN/AraC family two-component response regulator